MKTSQHLPTKILLTALFLATHTLGCLPYTAATSTSTESPRFDLLYNRQLARFEHQTELENHIQPNAWTPVATAWIDFIHCKPLDPNAIATQEDPLPKVVHASLLLEEARRNRLLIHALITRQKAWGQDTFFAQFYTPGFFNRTTDHLPPDLIHWPAKQESWADELPAPQTSTSQCLELQEKLTQTTLDQLTSTTTNVLYQALEQEILATENALKAADLPPNTLTPNTNLTPWTHRLHTHATHLHTTAAKTSENPKTSQKHTQKALAHLEILFPTHPNPQESPQETIPQTTNNPQLTLLYALLLTQSDRPDEATNLLETLETLPPHTTPQSSENNLVENNLWQARYLRLRIFTRAAQWQKAAQFATELPPPNHPTFSAYAYHATRAQDRAGFPDRALALTMAAFRDRPYEANPFLRAMYLDNLRRIADYPFETRTLELLEDMGPRNQLFSRVEEFATIALDHAQPQNAAAAATWLLTNQPDARNHSRYHAILAISAFFTQNHAHFDHAIAHITARSQNLLEAIPNHRRPQFFASADAELARVFRLMLPTMAEWGESPNASNQRQQWLQRIVTQTQDFLRTSPDSTARPQLLELYRMASAMLDAHPRGYTENLGDLQTTPLILGTVHLSDRELSQFEPKIDPTITPVFSLALIPRDPASPAQWPNAFNPEEQP